MTIYISIGIGLFLFAGIAYILYFFRNTKRFFYYKDQLEKADAIVVLGGWDAKERIEHGAGLFRKELAPWLLISEGFKVKDKGIADLMREYAVELGVPADRIILDKIAKSTEQNAELLKKIVLEKNIKKMILVTADYHSKRTKEIFVKAYQGTCAVIMSPVDVYSQEQWQKWFKHTDLKNFILMEIAKKFVTNLRV